MKKIYLLSVLMLVFTTISCAQESSYQLSSHILDITQGKPAPNVKLTCQNKIRMVIG